MLSSPDAERGRMGTGQIVLTYVLLIPLAVIFLAPLFWLISTSLKTDQQLGVWPPVWLPNPIVWDNYAKAWNAAPFALYTRNTLIITGFGLLGQLFSAAAVAYGFARLRFPGRDFLFVVVLATMMLPSVVTLIPTYILWERLGWLDTFVPLIVPAYFGPPFFIFLLRQFFRSIPMELSEAAKIDGASNFRILVQLILPLSKPALATVTIFSFMNHWNDFLGPLIYLTSQDNYTLTLGLRHFMGQYATQFQYMMAISFLMSLPIILVFFFAQQYFVRGVVMSGLKG
jgi:ABC-type glycerol-3-phosphate transport system permease component